MGVFAAVYLIGGIVYQRTVMHARGWRQIPHYHAWAAALGFIWVRVFAVPLLLLLRVLSWVLGRGRSSQSLPGASNEATRWKRGEDDWT
jgi:hypothetical protein